MYEVLLSPYSIIFYNEENINKDKSDYDIVFDQTLKGELDVLKVRSSYS